MDCPRTPFLVKSQDLWELMDKPVGLAGHCQNFELAVRELRFRLRRTVISPTWELREEWATRI